MLKTITIHKHATYTAQTPTCIEKLACTNYFFGTNGSGKSTIARVIDGDPSVPASCGVEWVETPLKIMVYNREFVQRNFGEQGGKLKGVFTLGEKDVEAVACIEEATLKLAQCSTDLSNQNLALKTKQDELVLLRNRLTDACWKVKDERDAAFKDAFEALRVRGSKTKFKDTVIEQRKANKFELRELEDLQRDAATLFGDEPTEIVLLGIPEFTALLSAATHSSLTTRIIGSEHVDVAALIRKLESDNWVSRGRDYLVRAEGLCPFCQRQLPEGLEKSFDEYFDDNYTSQKNELARLVVSYEEAAKAALELLTEISSSESKHIDQAEFSHRLETLTADFETNNRLLREKLKEPSSLVVLRPILESASVLANLIADANDEIARHNQMVSAYQENKARLVGEVWRFIVSTDLDSILSDYEKTLHQLAATEASIQAEITATTELQKSLNDEIVELGQKNTTIIPTKDAINNLLASLGFHGFHLEVPEDRHGYVLKREDGTLVENTLSEGERSFITFLYFYHLLKGSHENDGLTEPTVVVFDDPVSSLDSDILFVVSTLIRRICDETGLGKGHIKQVFMLTHNIHFHKEVTHNAKGKKESRTYWLVRKPNGVTSVERRAANPVKTAYHLLWEEVRRTDRSAVTVQNAMRRVLEYYFKTLGGVASLNDILDNFEGEELIAARSLISWVHDGSHNIFDDLYVCVDDSCVDMYLCVFKSIFYLRKQQGHFDMMWRETGKALGVADDEINLEQIDECASQVAGFTN